MPPDLAPAIGDPGSQDRACGSASPARGPQVLVVDDDPAVRASLRFSLELQGVSVEEFASAESLANRAAFNDEACLVVDYRLPGMDGLQLLALLRSRGSRAPAIIITSNPTRKLRHAIAEAGAVLVEKPLLCDELMASIWMLSAAQGPAGPADRSSPGPASRP